MNEFIWQSLLAILRILGPNALDDTATFYNNFPWLIIAQSPLKIMSGSMMLYINE